MEIRPVTTFWLSSSHKNEQTKLAHSTSICDRAVISELMWRPLDAGVDALPSSPVGTLNAAAVSELSQCHSEPSMEHVNRWVGCDGWKRTSNTGRHHHHHHHHHRHHHHHHSQHHLSQYYDFRRCLTGLFFHEIVPG